MSNKGSIFTSVALFLGLTVLSISIYKSVENYKMANRVVTVKGLAETEKKANLAIWPIVFKVGSDNLNTLYSDIENNKKIILSFLEKKGFSKKEISTSTPAIDDNMYYNYNANQGFRYKSTLTITVYTDKIDSVVNATKEMSSLIKNGVKLAENYYGQTQFIFSELNDIKPEMIATATKNAREVAEKFANDSQSKLGKIKQASQGQFSIRDRDSNTPYIKTIRVVSTISYFLVD